jgi:UDP-N-acetylmuramate dehydrogenase
MFRREGIPYSAIGSGTNLLVKDGGIEGVLIKLDVFKRTEVIEDRKDQVQLFVEAGLRLQHLVNFCSEKGYSGIEGLTGIPGTIGGAICGNAGSYGCEVKDVIQSAVIIRKDGSLERKDAAELGFGYRRSNISGDDILLSANIILKKDDPVKVAARAKEFFLSKKSTQPVSERSAGCVFRNPEGASAGKLIDEAGCKGMRQGGIEVSPMHANFFINRDGGTASDFLLLMDAVAKRVKEASGVQLEPEIKITGKDYDGR